MARYTIKNGPSKFELMVALFDGGDTDPPRDVHLVLWSEEYELTFERKMRISSCSRDRENNRWQITGEIDCGPLSDTIKTDWTKKVAVKGVFSTHDRKGFLEIA